MDIKDQNKTIKNQLDFEKMNETLANPAFANWYYREHEMDSKEEKFKLNIDKFIEVINNYTQQRMQ
ncbi:MAG: hypothetical protein RRZ84_05665 [Romboutsia sp.]